MFNTRDGDREKGLYLFREMDKKKYWTVIWWTESTLSFVSSLQMKNKEKFLVRGREGLTRMRSRSVEFQDDIV